MTKIEIQALTNFLEEWYIDLLKGCAQTVHCTFDDADNHAHYFMVVHEGGEQWEVKVVFDETDRLYDVHDRIVGLEDWDYCDYISEPQFKELTTNGGYLR